ncbi:hypothetical protein ACFSC6_11020 [Rufibacter sediminis]|uniref:Lipoprotein n=1 Tax=Rufibacter sediminis TaxID=2762756 RepID=A0ABR6VU64_9BACT|nr:hypothetical protein [Rufibacter sediminis]MBC3540412.1 hypothetical protein [Rufibacter sediminis]
MKKSLFLILCAFAFSCSSEKPDGSESMESASASDSNQGTEETVSDEAGFTTDSTKMTSDTTQFKNKAFFGTLISETGENCDQAMRRANDRARVFMQDHGKPCMRAATKCEYDNNTKLYTATANVHNHLGSC